MRSVVLRTLPAVALVAVAVAFYAGGAAPNLTPAGLAAHGQAWRAAAASHPLEAIGVYIAVFAALAAAGLPVALVLTLAAGLVFGPVQGALLAAAGAALAALLGYTAVRVLIGRKGIERLRRRWPRFAKAVDSLRAHGFWAVAAARLFPMMPFAVVNVVAGAARIPVGLFLAASMLGGLPSSIIGAGLGSGLAGALTKKSLAEVAESPAVWGPLLALSLLTALPAVLARRRAHESVDAETSGGHRR